mgnify:CR=1 FL=1
MAKRPDYDICADCTHTENVYKEKDGMTKCRAYQCECQEYVKK